YCGDRGCKRDTNIRAKSGRRERRRWESNPLRPGCSRWPGRLAPASRFWQYPRQESNLILDLRRVACASTTPRGRQLSVVSCQLSVVSCQRMFSTTDNGRRTTDEFRVSGGI